MVTVENVTLIKAGTVANAFARLDLTWSTQNVSDVTSTQFLGVESVIVI